MSSFHQASQQQWKAQKRERGGASKWKYSHSFSSSSASSSSPFHRIKWNNVSSGAAAAKNWQKIFFTLKVWLKGPRLKREGVGPRKNRRREKKAGIEIDFFSTRSETNSAPVTKILTRRLRHVMFSIANQVAFIFKELCEILNFTLDTIIRFYFLQSMGKQFFEFSWYYKCLMHKDQ